MSSNKDAEAGIRGDDRRCTALQRRQNSADMLCGRKQPIDSLVCIVLAVVNFRARKKPITIEEEDTISSVSS